VIKLYGLITVTLATASEIKVFVYKIECKKKFFIFNYITKHISKIMNNTVRTAWGEITETANKLNAYHHIKENDLVINLQGEIIGKATNYKARCTDTSPGSVHLLNDNKENIWISGDVLDIGNSTWVVTNNTNFS